MQTTKVLGYYNQNAYPVTISSESLGINTTVPPKSFVTDRSDRKINDSRLDAFCRGGMLVKTYSPTDVPLIALVPPTLGNIAPTKPPVTGTTQNAAPISHPTVDTSKLSATKITGMTVEEARRRGLIEPLRSDKFDTAPAEDTAGAAARSAPFIDQVGVKSSKRVAAPTAAVPSDAVAEALSSATAAAAEPEQPVIAPVAPVVESKKTVLYNGRTFTRRGDLRAHLRRVLKDDTAADETLSILWGPADVKVPA